MGVAGGEAQPQIQSWRHTTNHSEARGGQGGGWWAKLPSLGCGREGCSKVLTTGQMNLVQRQISAISASPSSERTSSQSQRTVRGSR